MTKIIGIDPGAVDTGVGIVKGTGIQVEEYSYGSIAASKDSGLGERLNHLYDRLSEIFSEAKPDLIVVEDVFFLARYPKSGIALGKVSGVILLAGFRADIQMIEIPVREAKQILTGNGAAAKPQLEKAVRHVLNRTEPIKPFHASDALALALIGLFRYEAIVRQRNSPLLRLNRIS